MGVFYDFPNPVVFEVNQPLSSVFFNLNRDEVVDCNVVLFLPGVPRDFDQFKSIEKRTREFKGVCGANEHYLGEIDRNADVVITEGAVLRGIQNLKQSMFRVTFVTLADLLDLIQKDDWVVRLCFDEGSDDDSRQSSYICSAVSP